MAFKTVQEFANLVQFTKKGDKITGKYLGSRKWHSEKKNKDFIVHTIETEDGHKQFFGAGGLDIQLKKAEKTSTELKQDSCVVEIEYLGLSEEAVPTAHGDVKVHQFDVRLDQ